MIGFSWDFCGNFNVLQHTLTDIRDSKTYQVKKLADGNIWMTQNLALVGPFYPDQSDSDVTWSKVTSGDNQTFMLTASDNGEWCSTVGAACINQSKMITSSNPDYGANYNWFSVTAGTGAYNAPSGNAPSSICPRGWKAPTATSANDSDFGGLIGKYTDGSSMRGVPNMKTGGYYYKDRYSGLNADGYYWSGTSYDGDDSNYVFMGTSKVVIGQMSMMAGGTIRCVAK